MRDQGGGAGIYGLTRMLAIEGAKYGINANVVAPWATTRILRESSDRLTEGADETTMQMMKRLVAELDPWRVSSVVAFLAHDSCPVSGQVFTVGGGHVSRFFMARTRGYYNPPLTVEDVRDHLDEIRDETDYTVPADAAEETQQLFGAIASHQNWERLGLSRQPVRQGRARGTLCPFSAGPDREMLEVKRGRSGRLWNKG